MKAETNGTCSIIGHLAKKLLLGCSVGKGNQSGAQKSY